MVGAGLERQPSKGPHRLGVECGRALSLVVLGIALAATLGSGLDPFGVAFSGLPASIRYLATVSLAPGCRGRTSGQCGSNTGRTHRP